MLEFFKKFFFRVRFFRTKKLTFRRYKYHNYNSFVQNLGYFGVLVAFETPWSHHH